jgi:hypothetical protein
MPTIQRGARQSLAALLINAFNFSLAALMASDKS